MKCEVQKSLYISNMQSLTFGILLAIALLHASSSIKQGTLYVDCDTDVMEYIGDGVCDIQNYKASCGYDDGDCSVIQFRKDTYVNITAESLGTFFLGQGRSELSFYFAGIGNQDSFTVDENSYWGYHFDRSVLVDNRYWYGLWAYVNKAGGVYIGWYEDLVSGEAREMNCGVALPEPKSKDPRFVQYVFDDMTLSLYVDGERKCSKKIVDEPIIFKAEKAPMTLGSGNDNNLNMDLIDIQMKYRDQVGELSSTNMGMEYVASWSYNDCFVNERERLGDGICTSGAYTGASCGYDDGDCSVIQFRKDTYVNITAESLGTFFLGQGRSELSFYFAGIGEVGGYYGYHFDRSVLVDNRYWYGRWAYVNKYGEVYIGWYEDLVSGEDREMKCGIVLPDPISKDPRFVQYVFDDNILSLYVDGERKCMLAIDEAKVFEAESAPMKMGTHAMENNYFNMDLIDIQLKQHGVVGNLQASSPGSFKYDVSWSSSAPSNQPSIVQSSSPSKGPSNQPSRVPSSRPTYIPSSVPSAVPSAAPSSTPSVVLSSDPSAGPSAAPSTAPSLEPSYTPSTVPSSDPSEEPSIEPSAMPTLAPSCPSGKISEESNSINCRDCPIGGKP